jgi:acetyl esterase/lipase
MPPAQTLPSSPRLDDAYRLFLKALTPPGSASAPGSVSIAEMRRAAALPRLAWQSGGPAMHEIAEDVIPFPHGPMRIRVYYPVPARPLPTLIYFHGGGWALLDIDTHDRIMREYAAASGWAVVGVDYPRAPEFRFPDIGRACSAAVEDIASVRARGLDRPIALAGDSSGANLALAAAIASRDEDGVRADALVLNYGVYDGSEVRPSYAAFSEPPFTLTSERMAWFWDQYCPDLAARLHPLASPLRADLRGLPPIRLVTTGLDVLRDENLALLVRLFEAGNAVSLDHHPRAPHAFLEALAIHAEARSAIVESAAWLKSTVRG